MVKLSVIDLILLVMVLALSVWVFGFVNGYDVAIAQRDYIQFMDNCHEIANTLDRIGR